MIWPDCILAFLIMFLLAIPIIGTIIDFIKKLRRRQKNERLK